MTPPSRRAQRIILSFLVFNILLLIVSYTNIGEMHSSKKIQLDNEILSMGGYWIGIHNYYPINRNADYSQFWPFSEYTTYWYPSVDPQYLDPTWPTVGIQSFNGIFAGWDITESLVYTLLLVLGYWLVKLQEPSEPSGAPPPAVD